MQPDLFVVPRSEVSRTWKTFRTLALAVEVVSPGSARGDRLLTRRLYQRQQVATYWIVDPDAQVVEVWRPADERPEIVDDVLRWRVAEDGEELTIDVPALFADIPRETPPHGNQRTVTPAASAP